MKTNFRRLLSMILTLSILLTLIPVATLAAWTPPATISIDRVPGGMRSFFLTPAGNPMETGFYYVRPANGGNNEVAYCVDAEANAPNGNLYDFSSSAISDLEYLAGIQAIIQHGYPFTTNGLPDEDARYATQTAIHWLENYCLGGTEGWDYTFRDRVTAPGHQGALDFARYLFDIGVNQELLRPMIVIQNPSSWTNAGGTLECTLQVDETDTDSWTVTSLPAGVSLVGGPEFTGDVTLILRLTDPVAYHNAVSHNVQITSNVRRTVTNIQAFDISTSETDKTLQKMVAVSGDMNHDPRDIELNDALGTYSIYKVTRTMDEGDVPEANAVFKLYPVAYPSLQDAINASAPIGTITTGADGNGDCDVLLPFGQYYLDQISSAPGSYLMNTNHSIVTIDSPAPQRVGIYNEQGDGYIDITKRTDKNGVLVVEPGAQFAVRNSAGVLVDTLVTDSTGHARSILLPYDIYTVTQTVAPAHTVINTTPLIFVVGANAAGEATHQDVDYGEVVNQEYKGTLSIHKVTNYTNQVPEANAGFQIYPSAYASYGDAVNAGAPVAMITTDANGNAQTGSLSYGTYVVHQYYAPTGTIRVTDRTVTIGDTNGADTHIDLINEVHTCSLSVEKQGESLITAAKVDAKDASGNPVTDGDGNALTVYDFYYENRPMNGASFSVYAGDEDIIGVNGALLYHANELVGTITTAPVTDASGTKYIATMNNLPLGADGTAQYVVRETVAPLGQTLSSTPLVFDFALEDETLVSVSQSRVMQDTKQDVAIAVTKQKEVMIRNATSGIYETSIVAAQGIVFGLYTSNDILSPNGTVIVKKDSLVDLLITGADGKATSTKDLPFGQYYAKELKVTEGVVWDKTSVWPLTVSPDTDGETTLVRASLNDGQPIVNRSIKGVLEIYKVASDTNLPLKDVVFEVSDSAGNLVDKLVTDENGKANTKVLPYGEYTLVETMTSTGYALGANQNISIAVQPEDGEDYTYVDLTLVNLKMAEIEIYKLTGEGEVTPMNGVVFGVFDAKTNAEVARIVTDEDGYGRIYMQAGDYYIEEIATWPGYALIAEKIPVSADWAGVYHYTVSNSPTTTKSEKTNPSGALLEGCGFTVTDVESGKLVEMFFDSVKTEYVALVSDKIKAPADAKIVTVAYTGKDGILTIRGLIANKKYTITEVVAPAGHKNDSTPQTITVPAKTGVLGTTRFVDSQLVIKTGEVEDNRYRIAGACTLIAASLWTVCFIWYRRMKRSEREDT